MDMKQPDEGNLFTDLMEFGPAPTMSREVVVDVISLAIIAALFAVLGVTVPTLVAAAVIVIFLGIRFVVGRSQWRERS